MDSRKHTTASAGISFVDLLTLVFVTLKLAGIIDWSWWWVLSPIWISVVIVVAILAVFFLWGLISVGIKRAKRKHKKKKMDGGDGAG